MNKKHVILIVLFFNMISCNKLLFNDIECREYQFTNEKFWFPEYVGDTVFFENSNNDILEFVIIDKSITHVTVYTENSGCGCSDISGFLMTNGNDSIWMINRVKYIYDNDPNIYEDVVFTFDGVQSVFNETIDTVLQEYSIGDFLFTNVKKFEYNYEGENKIKTVYFAQGFGIIRFEMVSGEIWNNTHLEQYQENKLESFTFYETTCE